MRSIKRRSSVRPLHDLHSLVDAGLVQSRRCLPARVGLARTLSDAPLTVRADADQLAQVLVALCTVSWLVSCVRDSQVQVTLDELVLDDAAPQRLSATWTAQSLPQRYARICVSNSKQHVGSAAEVPLLDPAAGADQVGEVGLEMRQIREIVSAHRGTFTTRRVQNAGTIFEICLPVVGQSSMDSYAGGESAGLPARQNASARRAAQALN